MHRMAPPSSNTELSRMATVPRVRNSSVLEQLRNCRVRSISNASCVCACMCILTRELLDQRLKGNIRGTLSSCFSECPGLALASSMLEMHTLRPTPDWVRSCLLMRSQVISVLTEVEKDRFWFTPDQTAPKPVLRVVHLTWPYVSPRAGPGIPIILRSGFQWLPLSL